MHIPVNQKSSGYTCCQVLRRIFDAVPAGISFSALDSVILVHKKS